MESVDASRQLQAIAEVSTLGVEVWLRGGWAMDFFLGAITRPHRDVDFFAWDRDADRLAAALTARGWELLPEPPHDRQLDFRRDGVDLSLTLIGRDGDGFPVVPAGPWKGERWPAGMLDGEPGRLGELRCAIVDPYAQIEIKKMMPVWVPGLARRPKDAEDIARLEAALARRNRQESSSRVRGSGPS